MAADQPVRHPWEEWVWDETVFQGTSAYYRQGRNPYAPGLADALADALGLDGSGRLLDVGCGPGIVTLLFARLFDQVVGVDADAGMVAEAGRATAEAGITNASWVQMRAEQLPGNLGTFRVVTFAQSFHWMDRPLVASAVRPMVEEVGAAVQVDMWHQTPPGHQHDGPHPPVPEDAIEDLWKRWLGPDRRAGQSARNTSPSGEDEIFRAAGFAPVQNVHVPDGRLLEKSDDDVVAWALSTSSMAPHLFGGQLPQFEAELRALLLETSPSGLFSVRLTDNRLRVHRPA